MTPRGRSRSRRRADQSAVLAPLRRAVGRPSKLTPERYETLLRVLAMGNYRCVAARVVRINPATLSRWLADPRPRYVEFREAVEHAEAVAEASIVANLVRLSRTNAQAGAWFLRTRYPGRWGANAQRDEGETPPAPVTSSGSWTAVPMPPGFAERYGIAEPVRMVDRPDSGDTSAAPTAG